MEMRVNLAHCDAAFQAETSQSCQRYLRFNEEPSMYQLSAIWEDLCDITMSNRSACQLADLGPLNLLVLISGEFELKKPQSAGSFLT